MGDTKCCTFSGKAEDYTKWKSTFKDFLFLKELEESILDPIDKIPPNDKKRTSLERKAYSRLIFSLPEDIRSLLSEIDDQFKIVKRAFQWLDDNYIPTKRRGNLLLKNFTNLHL